MPTRLPTGQPTCILRAMPLSRRHPNDRGLSLLTECVCVWAFDITKCLKHISRLAVSVHIVDKSYSRTSGKRACSPARAPLNIAPVRVIICSIIVHSFWWMGKQMLLSCRFPQYTITLQISKRRDYDAPTEPSSLVADLSRMQCRAVRVCETLKTWLHLFLRVCVGVQWTEGRTVGDDVAFDRTSVFGLP